MKKYNIIVIAVVALLIVLAVLLAILFNNDNKSFNLKNNGDNTYMPLFVSEEQMVRIYYNDFKNYIYSDKSEAYYKLNKEYREKKFSNYNNFSTYIDSLQFSNLKSYSVKRLEDKRIAYYTYSENDELIIFVARGIMQYEVYLDSDTINIE